VTAIARLAAAIAVLVLFAAACGSDDDGATSRAAGDEPTAQASGDPSTDKLAQVLARGRLILFTDLKYPPQSFGVKGAERPADTKCAANEITAPEVSGYDAETGKLVAKALGVEPCFVTASWTEVTGGNWGDRWDLAYGSGAVEYSRMEVLYMTQPYYSTPTPFFVPRSSKAKQPSDLDGKMVGACAGCTMEKYLRGTLKLPGPPVEQLVADPEIITFDTEVPGLKATAKGKVAAFLCSEPVGEGAIAEGAALRKLPKPAYYSNKTGYVDKESGLAVGPFIERVNEIVAARHEDGTLARLSEKFFGKDYAAEAAKFDIAALEQNVQ
jgi:polar amino acid transport system substrate-binding protein